ncbi:transketolase family protein [Crocosphaera watsonii]|nr:transketolase C-terminal domain-containing protein [Crocosphaera watsonii]CCQ50020.1 Transketolase, C-terminal section [Crocosphaera watsonii WH 8502]
MEGVNEANIIGMAAGLALEGKVVYVNTIATFITRRCFEQLVLDLGLHNVPVRLIGNGGGLVYAPLGSTHLAIDDIAILRTIPNMSIVAPADEAEMKRLMPLTVDYPGPLYIRLGKGNEPILTTDEVPFAIGQVIPMRQGSDALIITTGVTLQAALEGADELAQQGIAATVLHVPTVKPLPKEILLDYISTIPVVVTIEEHTLMGGLGSAIAELIAEANFSEGKRFKRIGLPDVFPDKYGSQADLMKRYGMTSQQVVAAVTGLRKKQLAFFK